MRWLLALPLLTAIASGQPVLTVSLENAITRPQNHGTGALIRPLVLFLSDWSGDTPKASAYTYTGTVEAAVTRLKSQAARWDAAVHYTVLEEAGAKPLSGEVTLGLTLHGTTLLGTYVGAFNGIAAKGAAEAGLSWDFTERDQRRGMLLWLPDPAKPVRALLLWGNGPGLSAKHVALREDLQAFGAANRVAVIGMDGYDQNMPVSGPAIHDGLKALAALSRHPELETAPILFSGHSMGGQIAYEYNAWNPERVIAFTVSKGGVYFHPNAPERARANPGVLVAGETDMESRVAAIHRLFDSNRPAGARWSLEIEEGIAHDFGASLPLFLLHFQHALDRPPAGGSRAWLADNATWQDGITRIFPAGGFPGEATRSSWLLDEDVAYVYRGIATYGNPLKLALAGGHGMQYFADETVEVECSDFGPGPWKSVALYDGASRIAPLTPQKPRVALTAQRPGVHAGVLLGERPDGALRTSRPIAWVVRPDRLNARKTAPAR
jgi:hypothetical protein